MTGMPEAALAGELGLCHVSLALVVDWTAGKGGQVVSMREIEDNLARCAGRVIAILGTLVSTWAAISVP